MKFFLVIFLISIYTLSSEPFCNGGKGPFIQRNHHLFKRLKRSPNELSELQWTNKNLFENKIVYQEKYNCDAFKIVWPESFRNLKFGMNVFLLLEDQNIDTQEISISMISTLGHDYKKLNSEWIEVQENMNFGFSNPQKLIRIYHDGQDIPHGQEYLICFTSKNINLCKVKVAYAIDDIQGLEEKIIYSGAEFMYLHQYKHKPMMMKNIDLEEIEIRSLNQVEYEKISKNWDKLLKSPIDYSGSRVANTSKLIHYNYLSIEFPKSTIVNKEDSYYSMMIREGLIHEVFLNKRDEKSLVKRIFYDSNNNPTDAIFFKNDRVYFKAHMDYSESGHPELLVVDLLDFGRKMTYYYSSAFSVFQTVHWKKLSYPGHEKQALDEFINNKNYHNRGRVDSNLMFRPENDAYLNYYTTKYGLKPVYNIR